MLIAAVLKYTPGSHPDNKNLAAALDKIKVVNDFVNERKIEQDSKRKNNEIQALLNSTMVTLLLSIFSQHYY